MSDRRRVLVFGAGGRLGGPVARQLRWIAPETQLRLATSRTEMVAPLGDIFPGHEVVLADLLDPESMERCFDGIDSAFLVTPNFLDEDRAMTHVASAIRSQRGFRQLFRVVGDQPGMTPARVPAKLRDLPGPAMQHHQARVTLDREGVEACYLNIANLMSNLFANAPGIVDHDVLAQVPRVHGWIDAGEAAEAAARLILSDDDRHRGQTYDLDNNHDVISWAEVTGILSSVLMRHITYDPSPEGFLRHVGPIYDRKMGFAGAADYFLEYFSWEARNDPAWRRTDLVERLIGRPPKTVRAWIEQNAASFERS